MRLPRRFKSDGFTWINCSIEEAECASHYPSFRTREAKGCKILKINLLDTSFGPLRNECAETQAFWSHEKHGNNLLMSELEVQFHWPFLLKVDFLHTVVVFEIKTQGNGGKLQQWVKTYQVSYSSQTEWFDRFMENGAVKVRSCCYCYIRTSTTSFPASQQRRKISLHKNYTWSFR